MGTLMTSHVIFKSAVCRSVTLHPRELSWKK